MKRGPLAGLAIRESSMSMILASSRPAAAHSWSWSRGGSDASQRTAHIPPRHPYIAMAVVLALSAASAHCVVHRDPNRPTSSLPPPATG